MLPALDDPQNLDPFQVRVERLLAAVHGRKRALLLTHDNPDPDSLASAWALGRLLEARAGAEITLAYGGLIGRAENRAMVKMLKIPVVPIQRVKDAPFDVVGLVDTQPEIGNHSLPDRGLPIVCIDHHPARPESQQSVFCDVGAPCGATSTLLTNYLRSAGVVPAEALATALFYGIKSDTRDLGRQVSPMDVEAYRYLIPLTNMPVVSAIEHPQLPRDYFRVLATALRRVRLHDNVALLDLGSVYVPDLVPEMADRLMTIEGVKWALVAGDHEGSLYLSVRVNDRRMRCMSLLRDRLDPLNAGSAGGHGAMAGARLDLARLGPSRSAQDRVRRRILQDLVEDMGGPSVGQSLLAPEKP